MPAMMPIQCRSLPRIAEFKTTRLKRSSQNRCEWCQSNWKCQCRIERALWQSKSIRIIYTRSVSIWICINEIYITKDWFLYPLCFESVLLCMFSHLLGDSCSGRNIMKLLTLHTTYVWLHLMESIRFSEDASLTNFLKYQHTACRMMSSVVHTCSENAAIILTFCTSAQIQLMRGVSEY